MKPFGIINYIVVVGYLVGIGAFGSSFYRRKSTPKEYFLGGRSMAWLPVGISIIAADLSAITVMGLPAWSYKYNLELLWANVGALLVAPIVIFVFVPFYAKLNLYTAYEYLERRFDLRVRLVTSILFQVLRGVHVAITIYAPSLVINLVIGLPIWECVLLMGLLTTIYTTLGGMKAVIWTDVIQFCTVMLGMLLIFFSALGRVDGGIATVYETALHLGHLKLFNFSTDPTQVTSFWACIFGGSILCLSPLATDQAILQRLFTTKSVEECRRSVILQAVVVVPISTLFFLAGTALFVFYYFNPSHLAELRNSDAIVPFFSVRELPAGASGLIIACIFAASMAVMSAGINALTTATTIDFYKRVFRPHETPEHYATVGRVGTLCWGFGMTLLALFVGRFGDLATAYLKVSSYVSGPLLGIFLLATLTARATAGGALTGAIVGMVVVALTSYGSHWSFFYLAPIGVSVTVVSGYLVSLLVEPPPSEKVRGLVLGHGRIRPFSSDEQA